MTAPVVSGQQALARMLGVADGTLVVVLLLLALLPVPVDLVGRRMIVALNMSAPVRNDAGYRRLFPPNTAPRAPPVPDSI